MQHLIFYIALFSTEYTTTMNILSPTERNSILETLSMEPIISISVHEIKLEIDCIKEYQFSISDLQGRLIQKGKFRENTIIDISNLNEGHYEIVIFNDCDLYRKPFKL